MKKNDEVLVKPDLRFPRVFQGQTTQGQFPWIISIRAVWNEATHSYEIDDMKLTRHSADPDVSPVINARTLRQLRVQDAFQSMANLEVKLDDGSPYAIPLVAEVSVEDGKVYWGPDPSRMMPVPMNKADADSVRLREASRIHAYARAFGAPPMKLVGDTLGISPTAVVRLMAKARERGLSEGA